jgi:hypothetical protein
LFAFVTLIVIGFESAGGAQVRAGPLPLPLELLETVTERVALEELPAASRATALSV